MDGTPTPWQALAMATSNRACDHLDFPLANDPCRLPAENVRELVEKPVSYGGVLSSDCQAYDGKAWLVLWYQMCAMASDMLGICHYHTRVFNPDGVGFEEFSRLLSLNAGVDASPGAIWEAARRAFDIERRLNVREGHGGRDDWLGDSLFAGPGPGDAGGGILDRRAFEAMLREYYSLQGWDGQGVPGATALPPGPGAGLGVSAGKKA
jgi:aldehyde:ferredoxin oxidoreductase